jgi:hypothetical protein
MNQLIEKLKNKRAGLFLTSDMEEILDNGVITRKNFTDICTSFYKLCINYLKVWTASYQHISELNTLSWIFMLQTN